MILQIMMNVLLIMVDANMNAKILLVHTYAHVIMVLCLMKINMIVKKEDANMKSHNRLVLYIGNISFSK